VLNAVTQQGQARFDLTGERAGQELTVSLPGLYRTFRVTSLPQEGTVPVVFIFTQPILPRRLP
jgi:hypothetical protein